VRWIVDDATGKRLLLEAGTCRYIDSRRYGTALALVSFDDAATCTREFAALLQALMALSEDNVAHYVVLSPEPVTYFHHRFRKYPIVSIHKGDTTEIYLNLLNEDPGNSPADAVGTNCYEWVILPDSHRWFVHCLRDSDSYSGHLWLPENWIGKMVPLYPWLEYPPGSSPVAF
jgi:hypothetical protein